MLNEDHNLFFLFFLLQTGCSPASAFASFSKKPSSSPKDDRMGRNAQSGLMQSFPNTLASNIPTFPRTVSPASYSPPASPLGGDVVIPCEFCGVALEEAVVFHHQVLFHFIQLSLYTCMVFSEYTWTGLTNDHLK